MTSIVVVATLTLLASFLCSLFEAALYSITPSRVELLKQSGKPLALRLAALREDVEEPIAAILTVNTIAHTVGSAWCGAMVGEAFGSAAVGIFAAIFTVLVLSVTEIVPKSVGVRYANELALPVVWPIQVMIWSVWPVVWASKHLMRLLTGGGGPHGPSEDEVVVSAALAARSGTVRAEEHRWVKNALRLDAVTAGDLRTPRTVVEMLPADTRVSDVADLGRHWMHSRVPVTEGHDKDRVLGVVFRREVFDKALEGALEGPGETTLRDLMRPIQFVPDAMPAHKLLDQFLTQRTHMAAVVDEFGGFEGVVTLEDVLEEMLGAEIVDEHDRHTDLQDLARRGRNR
ncbi:MAG: hemolysin family protein [Planctomycetota bacterium]